MIKKTFISEWEKYTKIFSKGGQVIMKSKIAIVVSAASDYNRGDQALLWRAKDFAKDAWDIEKYFCFESESEHLIQSQKEGFELLEPILHHPSHGKATQKNINYSFGVKMQWGISAIKDFFKSAILLIFPYNNIAKFVLNKKQLKTLTLLKNADVVLIKGGGYIHAYGKITDLYYIYYCIYNILLASRLKKKIYILPNSFGPLKGRVVKKMVYNALRRCTVVMTRESISKKLLDDMCIENSLQPDMAFLLDAKKNNKTDEILNNLKIEKGMNCVAITVRPYRFPQSKNPEKKYEEYKQSIIRIIDWLRKNNYRVILVEHTSSRNAHENDGKCIDEIIKEFHGNLEVLRNKNLDCKELKYIYSQFDYIIGTRFHSVIFGLSELVPGIAISYSGNKTQGIMKDIGLQEYVIDITEITEQILKEKFQLMVENRNKYIEIIEKYKKDSYANYLKIINKEKSRKWTKKY